MKKPRLFAIHLLNDFSGSPLVLRQSIECLKEQYELHLYTSTPEGTGFLSNIDDVTYHDIFYKWNRNKLITLLRFLTFQLRLCITLLAKLKRDDIVYINTLYPFGAAVAARIKGCQVVYHIHEVSIKPLIMKKLLSLAAKKSAHRIIFVSEYLSSSYRFGIRSVVIPNSLPYKFMSKALALPSPSPATNFTVSMLCSLKAYKGVYEFAALARQMPGLDFKLVLNTSAEKAEAFRQEIAAPANLVILSACKNTLPIYAASHLVVNLSRPDEWVETFGMTVLEAMACGRPVIVPQTGGVCELVDHGVQGFHINGRDQVSLAAAISKMANDPRLYARMSDEARERAFLFSPELYQLQLQTVISSLKTAQNPEDYSSKWNTGWMHCMKRHEN